MIGIGSWGLYEGVRVIQTIVWTLLGVILGVARAQTLDIESIARRNEGAAVVILAQKIDTGASVQSSGCFVSMSGLIITTAHQIDNVERLRAKFLDGSQHAVSVVAVEPIREIALLRCAQPPPAVARIGSVSGLRSGSPLVAIAAPDNLGFSIVAGIVSSTNRTYKGYRMIQTDLPADPGSSGGPVFDKRGNLVGMIVSELSGEDWVTFVNPIDNAYSLLRRHGVSVPGEGGHLSLDAEGEVIAADGITEVERHAIDAYNRGVTAVTAETKAEAYGAAVRLLPEFYEAWFNLAVAATGAGDTVRAIAAYERAIELRPDAVETHRNFGRLLLAERRVSEAVACFKRATRLKPLSATAHNDLGEAYRQAERLEDAERAFARALELDPAYASAYYNLALTLAARGRTREAVQRFRTYLKLAPDAADAPQVQGWIDKLAAKRN